MIKKAFFLSVILCAILPTIVVAQQAKDSTNSTSLMPFRKGRWLTGLSGSISSGSTSLDSAQSGISRNQYSFDFTAGNFIKDRILLGFILQLSRNNTNDFIIQDSEILFIGPQMAYYFTDNKQGSLFAAIAPGYGKFRELTGIQQNGTTTQVEIDGGGFGANLRLGYSYVIHDRIVFDLGLNFSNYWINADRLAQPGNTKSRENFRVGDISFVFGFNVLLDDFFF